MSRRCAVALTAALLVLGPATSALAAACPRTSLPDVEDEVMCLVCGVPQRERVFITRMVRQCRSKGEIESALVAQYGPRVLALPKASGFRLAAYVVPALVAAFAVGGLGLAAARRRLRRRASPGDELVRGPALDPLQAARIDAELDRYR